MSELNSNSNDNKSNKSSDSEFFLPDFSEPIPLFFLIIANQLVVIVLVLYQNPIHLFPWRELAFTSLCFQWITISTTLCIQLIGKFLTDTTRAQAATLSYLILLANIAIVSIAWQVVMYSFQHILLWKEFLETTFRHLLIGAILGGLVFRYFYLYGQLQTQKQTELTHRLQALQARIRPHFLFNSMNIIASLIEIDPPLAERVVEDLAELFRATFNDAFQQIPLHKEIALCRRYLHIEQLRMGSRLQVEWDIDPDVSTNNLIPLLTLQPLVENAIYHGIQPRIDGGTIHIKIHRHKQQCRITITNPRPQAENKTHGGNKMAISNINHRLTSLYGPNANLKTKITSEFYIIYFNFPLIETKNSKDESLEVA